MPEHFCLFSSIPNDASKAPGGEPVVNRKVSWSQATDSSCFFGCVCRKVSSNLSITLNVEDFHYSQDYIPL